MGDINCQVEKKSRVETNSKSVIFQKYYNFLDVFLKKDCTTLSLHQKYDHKIYQESK